jgi:hypothetical protein
MSGRGEVIVMHKHGVFATSVVVYVMWSFVDFWRISAGKFEVHLWYNVGFLICDLEMP